MQHYRPVIPQLARHPSMDQPQDKIRILQPMRRITVIKSVDGINIRPKHPQIARLRLAPVARLRPAPCSIR